MQTWKLMAAIVVSGGLLLLLLLLAANAEGSPRLGGPGGEHAPGVGEPGEEAWTPLALVGGTALLAGGAWIGRLERAGRRPYVSR